MLQLAKRLFHQPRSPHRDAGKIESMRQPRSPVIQSMLGDALSHHRAGRLNEAETIYRHILAMDARHADSLHLLGLIANQRGLHEAAAEMLRQAIAIQPSE